MFPILNPPPSSLPITSLWVVPVHQPQASSIVHRTWTDNSFLFFFIHCVLFPDFLSVPMSFFLSEGHVISLLFLDLCVPTASEGPSSNDDGSRPADTAAASETWRLRSKCTHFQKLPGTFPLSFPLKSSQLSLKTTWIVHYVLM